MNAAKTYTFKKQTLENCLRLSVTRLDSFVPIYPSLLRILIPEKINFGIWIQGTEELVEFINPALEPDEKALRTQEIINEIAKIQTVSRILVRRTDRARFFDHVREARFNTIKSDDLNNAVSDAYQRLSGCSSRIMSYVDKKVIEDAEQIAMETITGVTDNDDLIRTLADLISSHKGLYDHTAMVTLLSVAIGKKIDLSENNLMILALGSLFHDVGMTHIELPNLDTNTFSREAVKRYERHPGIGVNLLNEIETRTGKNFPEEIFLVALQHHERFNGTGFPNLKKGRMSKENQSGIHPFALIVGIADSFSLYFEDIKNRRRLKPLNVLRAMNRRDGEFHPELMDVFNEIMGYKKKDVTYKDGSVIINVEFDDNK